MADEMMTSAEDMPPDAPEKAVETPAVSDAQESVVTPEAPPVAAEEAPAHVAEPVPDVSTMTNPAPAAEEDLPEPPNNPPPSLDPTAEKPAALPGLEAHVEQIGKMRLEIARLETENAALQAKLAAAGVE